MERPPQLSAPEMRLLILLLIKASDHFSRHSSDYLDFAAIVPDIAERREIMRKYHLWNGDPEEYEADEKAGATYAFTHMRMLLHFFAACLSPELEQALRTDPLRW